MVCSRDIKAVACDRCFFMDFNFVCCRVTGNNLPSNRTNTLMQILSLYFNPFVSYVHTFQQVPVIYFLMLTVKIDIPIAATLQGCNFKRFQNTRLKIDQQIHLDMQIIKMECTFMSSFHRSNHLNVYTIGVTVLLEYFDR